MKKINIKINKYIFYIYIYLNIINANINNR